MIVHELINTVLTQCVCCGDVQGGRVKLKGASLSVRSGGQLAVISWRSPANQPDAAMVVHHGPPLPLLPPRVKSGMEKDVHGFKCQMRASDDQ